MATGGRRFTNDKRGALAIEFALVVPLILLLFIMTQDLALAFSFKKKLNNCSSNVADLVAQMTTISVDSLRKVLDSRSAILAPFDDKRLGMRVSLLKITSETKSLVSWSIATNGGRLSARAKGSDFILPAELQAIDEKTFLYVESEYVYPYTFGEYGLSGVINLSSSSFARSRGRAVPDCADC